MPPKKAAAGAKDKGKSGKGSSADDDKSKDKKNSSAGSSIKVIFFDINLYSSPFGCSKHIFLYFMNHN